MPLRSSKIRGLNSQTRRTRRIGFSSTTTSGPQDAKPQAAIKKIHSDSVEDCRVGCRKVTAPLFPLAPDRVFIDPTSWTG
jgi:hypothetical protein